VDYKAALAKAISDRQDLLRDMKTLTGAQNVALAKMTKLRAAGDAAEPPLAPGQRVALPSEAAWERAARYPRGGRYPWGRRWSPERANTAEGRVLRTTPVGVYPSGATAHAIHDLSGNVWEWTASLYRDYPYRGDDGREDPGAEGRRVVRGGSWYNDRRLARCASRAGGHPDNFLDDLGFRVVVSLADSVF
jgi:formylglycine-generating enzyme required for sulfatase activity